MNTTADKSDPDRASSQILPCSSFQKALIEETRRSGYRTHLVTRVWNIFQPGESHDCAQICDRLKVIVCHHEVLRTRFIADSTLSSERQLVGMIDPCKEATLQKTVTVVIVPDAAEASRQINEFLDGSQPGKTAMVQPFSARVFCTEDDSPCILAWKFHRSLMDEASHNRLVEELIIIGDSGGAENSEVIDSFWKGELSDASTTILPPFLLSSNPTDQQPAQKEMALDFATLSTCGISPVTLMGVAWGMILGELTDSDNVIESITLTTPEISPTALVDRLGQRSTIAPVRVRINQEETAMSAIKTMQVALKAEERQSPWALDNAARAMVMEPSLLTPSVITYHGSGVRSVSPKAQGSRLRLQAGEDGVPLSLYLTGWRQHCPKGDKLVIRLERQHGFRYDMACLLLARLMRYCQRLCDEPAATIRQIRRGAAEEEQHLQHRSREDESTFGSDDLCIDQMFTDQVRQMPQKVAVQEDMGYCMTYEDLNTRSDHIGAILERMRSRSLCQERERDTHEPWVIGIYFERSIDMIVAILAILKAGAACLPLDPNQPQERLSQIIRLAKTSLVLCGCDQDQEKIAQIAKTDSVSLLRLDQMSSLPQTVQPLSPGKTKRDHGAGRIAFTLFTSGSTGEPKGVMVSHRAFVTLARSQLAHMGGWRSHRMPVASALYVTGMGDIITTLCLGGRLTMIPTSTLLRSFPDWARQYTVTELVLTPTVATLLNRQKLPFLQHICLCGEAMDAASLTELPEDCAIWQRYGSTETLVVSVHQIDRQGFRGRTGRLPIGKAIPAVGVTLHCYHTQDLVPIGAVGEIWARGPQVARGYLDRPDFTRARFLADPNSSHAGALQCRTGDLGRFRADGTLECLGRTDSKVKIRGQRVEIGELEAVASQHASVVRATMVKVEVDSPSGSREELVGFLDSRSTQAEWSNVAQDVQAHIQAHLPSYMVPAKLFPLSSADLPRTPSGKIDCKTLTNYARDLLLSAAPKEAAPGGSPGRPPINSLERNLCDIFAEEFRFPVGPCDGFIDIGGHSITAIRIVSKIRKRLLLDLNFRDILKCSTIATLATQIEAPGGSRRLHSSITTIKDRGSVVEQSFAQKRLWLLHQLQPGLFWTLIPYAWRVRGLLDLDALHSALTTIEQRHETLRTTFEHVDGADVQVVHEFHWRPLTIIDILPGGNSETAMLEALVREQTTPMDLQRQPGWRACIFRLKGNDHIISLVIHHIVTDGWSSRPLTRELHTLYAAALQKESPDLEDMNVPIQYSDFIIWQQQPRQVAKQHEQLHYWVSQLQDSQPARFPCDKERPPEPSGVAQSVHVSIEGTMYEQLQQFCREVQATPFAVLLSAFRATHYRMTGAVDATIGTPIANREHEELENLIGLFVNTQCMRIPVAETQSFRDLVGTVKKVTMDAFAHQAVPFDQIVSEIQPTRDLSQNSLVQVIFAVHPGEACLELQGCDVHKLETSKRTRFDLEFHLFQNASGLHGEIHYSVDIFEHGTIQALADVFCGVLAHGMVDLGGISSLRLQKTNLITSFVPQISKGCPDEVFHRRSLTEEFCRQVELTPHRVAVKDSASQMTYAELDDQSSRLSRWLILQGLAPESLVALLANRSCEAIVAILGVLKANLAYLPLDVRSPTARTETILRSMPGSRRLMLIGKGLVEPLPNLDEVESVRVQDILNGVEPPEIAQLVGTVPTPRSLAYVIFTSGSTGVPKGVMIEHGAVVSLIHRLNLITIEEASQPFAHMANLAFDAATWEIYTPLLNGGTIICIEHMTVLDYPKLGQVFSAERIRTAFFTTALVQQCVVHCPDTLRQLRTLAFGGEALGASLALSASVCVDGPVFNVYGPTENTVFSTMFPIRPDEISVNGPPVPIGRAISGCTAHVADPLQQVVPDGVVGELVLTGDQLARGYTDPSKDEGRFVTILVDGAPTRAYRTGDRVRRRPWDGNLEFLGRLDDQVKIRGFRVELGEIEHALCSNDVVREAAVIVMSQSGPSEDTKLTAFVTLNEGQTRLVDEDQQVDAWKTIFHTNHDYDPVTGDEVGRDFVGWTSMYDGQPLAKADMIEWLQDTMTTIRLVGHPLHGVLEVGTGSGMILFNLGDGLHSYVGIEPARSSVEFVRKSIPPGMVNRVQIVPGSATDIDQLDPAAIPPDLAVINSVAQYFPSGQYLLHIIESLLRRHRCKAVFLGDIRSLALYPEFQVTKTLHQNPKASVEDVQRGMMKIEYTETELLVDPAFFMSLPELLPDLVRHVQILPKRMNAVNELSSYRYAAVIYACAPEGQEPIHSVPSSAWVDYHAAQLDKRALLQYLQEQSQASSAGIVAVANIPPARTAFESLAIEYLNLQPAMQSGHDESWIVSIRRDAATLPSLSPTELDEVAQQAGYQIEISWARQHSQRGGYDAIFHRLSSNSAQSPVLFQFPSDAAGRPIDTLSNHPISTQLHRQTERDLLQRVQQKLPAYMAPASIHILDSLPVNLNGKVDRKALARRKDFVFIKASSSVKDAARVPPQTPVEEVICAEFASALSVDVGRSDDFFSLGGHSLIATRVLSRISQQLNCTLAIRDLFDYPSPMALAEKVSSRQENEGTQGSILPSHDWNVEGWRGRLQQLGILEEDVAQVFSCTPFQEGVLWASKSLATGGSFYQTKLRLTMDAPLDWNALQAAWKSTVEQEEMLRSLFLDPVARSPGFCQAILRADSPEARRVATVQHTFSWPVDEFPSPTPGKIPVSLWLVAESCSASSWHLGLCIHHALYDEAYLSRFLGFLADRYHASREGKLCHNLDGDIPFSHFARTLHSRDPVESESFWHEYMQGAPPATWPVAGGLTTSYGTDQPPRQSRRRQWEGDSFELARRLKITPAALARAAVALVLSSHADTDDLVFGEVSTGRTDYVPGSSFKFIAGPCIATHPVRVQFHRQDQPGSRLPSDSAEPPTRISVAELVPQVHDAFLRTHAHRHMGLGPIQRQSDHPESLPFQVLFVFQQPWDDSTTTSPRLRLHIDDALSSEFPLLIEAHCDPQTGCLNIRGTFDPTVLVATDMDWILRHIVDAIESLRHDNDVAINKERTGRSHQSPEARLKVQSSDEIQLLQQLSAGSQGNKESTSTHFVHHHILEQARQIPDKIAIQWEFQQFVTFRELDGRSDTVARALQALLQSQRSDSNAQPLIPVAFDKTPGMVIAVIGVLKAGAAFVPLDLAHPVPRIQQICDATEATILLWDGHQEEEKVSSITTSRTSLSAWSLWDLERFSTPVAPSQPLFPVTEESLAYVMFTSGSTGAPKGVMVTHRNLRSLVTGAKGFLDCSWTANRILVLSNTFDPSVGDIFGQLCRGGRLSLVRNRQLMSDLAGWISRLGISHAVMTPSLANVLADDLHSTSQRLAHLKTLWLGGEPFDPRIIRDLPRELTVWNLYGPTEATVAVTGVAIHGPRSDVALTRQSFVSIGRPLGDSRVYVLQPGRNEPVPVGAVGELCIAGPQVARGYLGRPDLTARHFIDDARVRGGRLYRTGDRARLHGDGCLQLLGRIDNEVKIRGQRLDADTVAATLQEVHPSVKSCVVTKIAADGTELLWASVQVDAEDLERGSISESSLRQAAASQLPQFMLPNHIWLQSETFPLATSGKIDAQKVAALAEAYYQQQTANRHLSSASPTKIAVPGSLNGTLAATWAAWLGIAADQIDITASFGSLGGDSIRAVGILTALRRQGISLGISDFTASSTIEMQAAKLNQALVSAKQVPHYMTVFTRSSSQATMILMPPLLQRAADLTPLVELVDERFDIILIDDPFWGTTDCPGTLSEWAAFYLDAVEAHLPRGHSVVLGGYSFGGLLAFEMSLLWQQRRGGFPLSLLLLDATPLPLDIDIADLQRFASEKLGLKVASAMEGYLERLAQVWGGSRRALPVYQGNGLHVVSSEMQMIEWWKEQCPRLTVHSVTSSHLSLLRDALVHQISSLVNHHLSSQLN